MYLREIELKLKLINKERQLSEKICASGSWKLNWLPAQHNFT